MKSSTALRPGMMIGALAMIVGLAGCVNPIAFASKKAVPLSYVGPVAFGQPVARDGRVIVPLIIDYSQGQWMQNSALAAYGTTSSVTGKKIEFSVLNSLTPGNNNQVLELRLPRLAAGEYAMVYVDPDQTTHAVGSITVKK